MIAPYRGLGIVIDIGTGDGRFVSASAKANPDQFFIGIDANAKPLEKLSTKITRKPAKGGLPNTMFVQAAVEDLPEEFAGIADEIYINFPWGSLLGAVANGDQRILALLSRSMISHGRLTVTMGIDPRRDHAELDRLGIPQIGLDYLGSTLKACYQEAGFRMVECRELAISEWSRIETSWARKLGENDERKVFQMEFVDVT